MEEGAAFDDAVRDAQANGFAEGDPSLDIDGIDTAQKMQILAALAFDAPVRRMAVTGIRGIDARDVESATRRNRVIRLVGEASRIIGGVDLRVEPRELPREHPFARMVDETNAVQIEGRAVGELLLVGKGAGALPAAAAVLSDVIASQTTAKRDLTAAGTASIFDSPFMTTRSNAAAMLCCTGQGSRSIAGGP
jgi:homoserine dehydrogenase